MVKSEENIENDENEDFWDKQGWLTLDCLKEKLKLWVIQMNLLNMTKYE